MFRSDPVGLPGLAALALGLLLFVVALLAARGRRADGEHGARRAGTGSFGVLVQGLGFALAGFGPILAALDPMGGTALGEAAAVASLIAVALALFVAASRAMGRNWSIRARTRADHQLVQHGPFRLMRHPIYVAMALYLVALALAFGHTRQLLLAVPVFTLGTALRIRGEEALLAHAFGPAYTAYAARVRRFGLF